MTDEPRWATRRLLDAPHLPITAYLAFIGAASVTDPLADHLPTWLSLAWSFALLFGAGLIVFGVATQQTRPESAGHGFHLFGLGFLLAVSIAATDLNDLAAVLALAGVSVLRLRVLSRSREAKAEANRLLLGEADQ